MNFFQKFLQVWCAELSNFLPQLWNLELQIMMLPTKWDRCSNSATPEDHLKADLDFSINKCLVGEKRFCLGLFWLVVGWLVGYFKHGIISSFLYTKQGVCCSILPNGVPWPRIKHQIYFKSWYCCNLEF